MNRDSFLNIRILLLVRLITASAATAPENHEQVFHLPPQLHLLLYHKLISLTATCRSLYVIFVEGLMRHDETAIFDGTVHNAVKKCSPRTEFPALLIAVAAPVYVRVRVSITCVLLTTIHGTIAAQTI